MLFDSLPYASERTAGVFWKKTDWTEEEFLFVRGRVPGFDQLALYRHRDVILRDGDAPAHLLPGISASAELLDVLGAYPMLGRSFHAGDDVQGAEPVAVLSLGLWQEMGGDRSIVGKRLTLDGSPRTVVGVMPRGFWFPDPEVRIWTPGRSASSRAAGTPRSSAASRRGTTCMRWRRRSRGSWPCSMSDSTTRRSGTRRRTR